MNDYNIPAELDGDAAALDTKASPVEPASERPRMKIITVHPLRCSICGSKSHEYAYQAWLDRHLAVVHGTGPLSRTGTH